MGSIESRRRLVDPFFEELNEEYYLNLSGQKEDLNSAPIYEKYSSLFTRENLEIARREIEKTRSADKRRRLRYLVSFVVSGILEREVRDLTDRAETASSKESVKVDGKEVPFRLTSIMMVQERDRAKRAGIDLARNRKIEDVINPILEPRMEKLHEVAVKIGYQSYLALYDEVKNLNLEDLEKTTLRILSKTEEVYREKMDGALRKSMELGIEEAEKHDVSHLLRALEFDSYFPREEALPTLKRTLASMGFQLHKRKNILLDLDERPRKSPRAFVAPIRVPQRIELVLMPRGGLDDYSALLHEAGHAMHFSSPKPRLPVEYRRLGDTSVSETFAFLFQYLMKNRLWLKKYTSMRDLNRYLEFQHMVKLYFLRRYSAKLSYEIRLHSGREEDFRELYTQTLEDALIFQHPSSHYLCDVDDGFYVAQYLRAWIFQAQLGKRLTELFGEDWFLKTKPGEFLERLWIMGEKYDVVELAQKVGHAGLDENPLVEELTSSWNG